MSDGEGNSISDANGKHSSMTFKLNDENRFKVRPYHYLWASAHGFGALMSPIVTPPSVQPLIDHLAGRCGHFHVSHFRALRVHGPGEGYRCGHFPLIYML